MSIIAALEMLTSMIGSLQNIARRWLQYAATSISSCCRHLRLSAKGRFNVYQLPFRVRREKEMHFNITKSDHLLHGVTYYVMILFLLFVVLCFTA